MKKDKSIRELMRDMKSLLNDSGITTVENSIDVEPKQIDTYGLSATHRFIATVKINDDVYTLFCLLVRTTKIVFGMERESGIIHIIDGFKTDPIIGQFCLTNKQELEDLLNNQIEII